MNKKIFAALASATMALSATGSLAVFAEDFDVVTEADGNNGGVSGVVVPNASVKLTSENFPDQGFLNSLLTAFGKNYGAELKSDEVKGLKTLYVGKNVKNLDGIAVFGNLTKVLTGTATYSWNATNKEWTVTPGTTEGADNLVSADLSDNAKLETVTLTGAKSLQTLMLPETKTLTSVTVDGAPGSAYGKAPITEIDLSGNKFLNTVNIQNTNVAKIDLSNNLYLTTATLSNNDLNTVDLTNCASLTKFIAPSNELYGIELPGNRVLAEVDVTDNLLQELDVTGLPSLTTLKAGHNELRTIDLSDCTDQMKILQLEWNHLGALEIPAAVVRNARPFDGANSSVNPQVMYVDDAFNAVNLADSFENFDADLIKTAGDFDKKTNVLTLDGNQTTYEYWCNSDEEGSSQVVVVKASVLNRLYNPNSGEHFYTSDIEEKDALVTLGWKDEGIGWVSPTTSQMPVYRLYNPNAGDHHYTTNAFERDTLTSIGWKNEGIGWYSYPTNGVSVNGVAIDPVNVLREYNPNAKAAGAHNYTINHAENDFLVSVGWLDEGIAWQSMK